MSQQMAVAEKTMATLDDVEVKVWVNIVGTELCNDPRTVLFLHASEESNFAHKYDRKIVFVYTWQRSTKHTTQPSSSSSFLVSCAGMTMSCLLLRVQGK